MTLGLFLPIVSLSSLQSQCLSKILRSEAPKIDATRNNQLKLQGEFIVQIRALEEKLLDALNSIQGIHFKKEIYI